MLTALLLSGPLVLAQESYVPDIPPSPQAVAFNRLGDYQVNNNYGVPDINIPLFEIDCHGYKIPLTLHYEASPLKSGYNYDVTGFGWTLSGNSCVSRTIKDRADEYIFLNYSSRFALDTFQEHLGGSKMYVNYKDELDQLNYQYDTYNIVLPSGRTIPFFMYMGSNGMVYERLSSDANVKITCSYDTNGVGSITAFIVTDEYGVTYYFTLADKTATGFDNDPNANRNVTWLLTRIDIPSKGTINYEYTELQSIQTNIIEEPVLRVSRLMSQMPEDAQELRFKVSSPPQPECPRYKMRFLSRISYDSTKIAFNYQPDSCHMKEIVVLDYGDTIRKYSLGINSSSYGSKLTSLVISGQDDESLVYDFTYTSCNPGNRTDYWGNRCYSNGLKDIGNFNMYFNNEEDGHRRLDRNDLQQRLSTDNLVQLIDNEEGDPNYYYKVKLQSTTNGDTRQPRSPEQHGVLQRITYPNGGYTTFTWENHRFPTATAENGDFVFDRRRQRIIEGGGFRIKSVINWTADGEIANEDHYRYGFTLGDIIHRNFPLPLPENLNLNDTVNQHIGCGEAVVDPNLLTFMTFTYYKSGSDTFNNPWQFQKMVLGQDSEVRNMINPLGAATWWDAYFSANTFRALLGGRRPVVYPEITVYHGDPDIPGNCKSKTVYKYDIYAVHHDAQTYYLLAFDPTAVADTAYFERTCYYYSSDAPKLLCDNCDAGKRHLLKSKCDYSFLTTNSTWNLVSEEEYSYNTERMSKEIYIFNSHLSREYRSNYTYYLGNNQWLSGKYLSEFYKPVSQWFGRSTISEKTTTILREGGTRSWNNMQKEHFSYQYPGILKQRDYTDPCLIEGRYKHDVYSYVGELESTDPVIVEMQSRNMLASLASSETYTTEPCSLTIAGNKIDYAFYDNKILPSKIYERNGDVYEGSIQVLSYGSFGNPTEIVDLKTGIPSVFLWGSYGRYLTAMIKNATLLQLGDVSQLFAMPSWSRHASLKALLPNAQIQTWDYKPLIGVSSHTDVNGQTILYEYDGLGRLKAEKRMVNGVAEPEILRKYEYNYLNQ